MKESYFVDTGYWLAIFNRKDCNHQKAKSSLKKLINARVFVSDFIVFETITFFNSSLKNHNLASVYIDFIFNKENIEIVEVDQEIKKSAIQLFLKYDDKCFSFTDCTSFIIMAQYNIKFAFAFDEHFKQMGFSIL